jgi:poly(hydroxyalkanoate) depolymerase family esterase
MRRRRKENPLRRISDTIARLSALRARQGLKPSAHSEHDRLTPLNTFESNPGSLSAWCHIPEELGRGAPLVVVLHGCTQSAGSYDHHSGWSRLADEARFAVLYPEQQRSNNPNLCFNWFEPNDVARGRGEAHSIYQMIKAMIENHGLDPERVYVAGLSAGGAMAGAMLASYPEVFAGGAILSGLAFGTAATVPQAFDRMRGHGNPSSEGLQRRLRDASKHTGPWPRISIWQGDADRTVDASNASVIASQWQSVHQIAYGPTHSHDTARHQRQSWHDQSGASVLELNLIEGMGHGAPLDTRRLGVAGPFMLDVGISSTHEIAQFWNIMAERPDDADLTLGPTRELSVEQRQVHFDRSRTDQRGESPERATSGVQKVIEDALRSAGLMR